MAELICGHGFLPPRLAFQITAIGGKQALSFSIEIVSISTAIMRAFSGDFKARSQDLAV